MSEFKNKEIDLCKRTLANLKFIENAKKQDKEVYETTQLFNSLLGIIVNIREESPEFQNEFGGLYSIPITLKLKKEWGIPDQITEGSVGMLVYNLRNSIAHIDIEFKSTESSEIKSVIFHFDGEKQNRGTITFPIEKLGIFIRKLCEQVCGN